MSDTTTIDLSNYKDRVGSRVKPGRYRVLVEDAELDKSKAGNTMINMWLRVVGGEFAGSTLVDRLTITEKSLFRVVGFMQAIGLPTPKKRVQLNLSTFVGKQLDVDVEDGEPYNGRTKSEVRGYLRIPAGERAATVPADLPPVEDEGPTMVERSEPVSDGWAQVLPPQDADFLDTIDDLGEEPEDLTLDEVNLG